MSVKLEVANRLRELRKKTGKTQKNVGTLMSLPRPSITEIELGQRNVTVPELVKFAAIYGVSTNYIATGRTAYTELALQFVNGQQTENQKRVKVNLLEKLIKEN